VILGDSGRYRFKHTSSNPAAPYVVSGTPPLCFLQLQANQAGQRCAESVASQRIEDIRYLRYNLSGDDV
jgi:hypothetical protein